MVVTCWCVLVGTGGSTAQSCPSSGVSLSLRNPGENGAHVAGAIRTKHHATESLPCTRRQIKKSHQVPMRGKVLPAALDTHYIKCRGKSVSIAGARRQNDSSQHILDWSAG